MRLGDERLAAATGVAVGSFVISTAAALDSAAAAAFVARSSSSD
jgi:hypothetical protein